MVIAFIGSVFSPYYAWARQRHRQQATHSELSPSGIDPLNFCAINVALYDLRTGRKRWAMTERGRAQVQREPTALQIGRSALRWQGDALRVTLDELTSPWPSRIRGSLVVRPAGLPTSPHTLSTPGQHLWQPLAPCARAEVDLSHPGLRWSGPAYLDHNRGERALEDDFVRWDWSRAPLSGGRSAVLYDALLRGGGTLSLALAFGAEGEASRFEPPATATLPPSSWGIARATRSGANDRGTPSAVVSHTLEDTPFYARSLLQATLCGERVVAVHESLSLQRFAAPWVRCLLPFRMPRVAGARSGPPDVKRGTSA